MEDRKKNVTSGNVRWSGREECVGDDYYGTFFSSLYTLFQVLTGESWSELVVRPVLHFYRNEPISLFGAASFFVSFIVINAFVLINVVVAVLLDGMNAQPADDAEDPPSPQTIANSTSTASEVAALREDIREMRQDLKIILAGLGKTKTEECVNELEEKIKAL